MSSSSTVPENGASKYSITPLAEQDLPDMPPTQRSAASLFSLIWKCFQRKVCGLNKKTAAGLVALREKMGRIQSREDIKSVKGLGAKSFEQCAGFLTVNIDSENCSNGPVKKKKKMSIEPLDKTIVHPSQYNSARR
ncbi:hypothetical protein TELCIR_10464 [Teladorsagia circumcincta]|uniref:Uncharacterized protein n=1 Tax=Teladorsagia circumcincta TaxID=45464 RepID=A0A2G9UC32_TELCI|nr:hypothetical protein TELCIR_10464 [Teladorsagia circumcincta]